MLPFELFSVNPAGRAPEANVHDTVGCPPVEVSGPPVYGVPRIPLGKVVVLITSNGLMMSVKSCDCACGWNVLASVTVALNVKVPETDGAPETTPAEERETPDGKPVPPALSTHEYGGSPPEAPKEYV